MALKYNQKYEEFYLVSNNRAKAHEVGLTESAKAKGPGGEPVWFTDSPYAALCFYEEAEGRAKEILEPLHNDYMASVANEWKYTPKLSPEGLEYMPFQNAGIDYSLNHDNALIGDAMGLGKTMQGIGVANEIGAKNVIVACPGAVRLNWQREIKNWSTLNKVSAYPILKSSDGVNPYSNYIIVSYDLLRNEAILHTIANMKWDLAILDEGHFLKSVDAKRTQAVFGTSDRGAFHEHYLLKNVAKTVALTGTPLPNRPRECYTLTRGLCWEAIDWQSYEAFMYRYNPSGRTSYGSNLEMRGRLPELRARLRCNYMVRRLKEDVLKDLPDKRYEMTYVETNGKIKEVIAKERMLDYDVETLKNPSAEIDGQIATVRREMGEAKVGRVIEHIKYLLDIQELEKVVIFSHHKSVMNEIKDKLDKYGVAEVRGGMNATAKQKSVDDFVNSSNVRVWSGQMDAANVGIDGLQKVCQYVVFCEPSWTPGVNEQAIDRLHRHGQHGNVVAQFIIVEGSLDERVLASNFNKTQTIHSSLDAR